MRFLISEEDNDEFGFQNDKPLSFIREKLPFFETIAQTVNNRL